MRTIARYRLKRARDYHNQMREHLIFMRNLSHSDNSRSHAIYLQDLHHRAECEYRCSQRIDKLITKYL